MEKVVTGEVRLTFTHILEPRVDEDGVAKYSVTVLVPKSDTETLKKIQVAIERETQNSKEKWGGVIPPKVPNPMHDGDGEKVDGTPFPAECHGHYVFTATTKDAPGFIDKYGGKITDSEESYSGMYGRVSFNVAGYKYQSKKGIGFYLNNVQKLRDGEKLGYRKATASEDFSDSIETDTNDFSEEIPF